MSGWKLRGRQRARGMDRQADIDCCSGADDGIVRVWVSSRWPEDTILARQGGSATEVTDGLIIAAKS